MENINFKSKLEQTNCVNTYKVEAVCCFSCRRPDMKLAWKLATLLDIGMCSMAGFQFWGTEPTKFFSILRASINKSVKLYANRNVSDTKRSNAFFFSVINLHVWNPLKLDFSQKEGCWRKTISASCPWPCSLKSIIISDGDINWKHNAYTIKKSWCQKNLLPIKIKKEYIYIYITH